MNRSAEIQNWLHHPLFYVSLCLLGIAIILGLMLHSSTSRADVAAMVNGEAITKDALIDEMMKQMGKEILDSLINKRLIIQEAEKKGIKITEEEIDAEVAKTADRLGGQQALEQALAMSGITMESFRESTRINLMIEKILGPEIVITEEDMEKYFDEHKEELGTPEQIHARHILVDTEEEAAEIKRQLEAGADFSELAKKQSKDSTAQNGGDLGFFSRGKMAPEFDEVAFSLKVGEISDPVKTDYGYHIIRVEEKRPAVQAVYENVKDRIRENLFTMALQEKVPAWLDGVRKAAKIEDFVSKK